MPSKETTHTMTRIGVVRNVYPIHILISNHSENAKHSNLLCRCVGLVVHRLIGTYDRLTKKK